MVAEPPRRRGSTCWGWHPLRPEWAERLVARVAVLELDVGTFRWPGHRFRVVANPPYAGINALVRRLLALQQLRSADLVVAESAARGLLRRHPGRLERGFRVPRAAFGNRAPGDAVVVRIRR